MSLLGQREQPDRWLHVASIFRTSTHGLGLVARSELGRLLLAADALEEPLMIAALKREVREANLELVERGLVFDTFGTSVESTETWAWSS